MFATQRGNCVPPLHTPMRRKAGRSESGVGLQAAASATLDSSGCPESRAKRVTSAMKAKTRGKGEAALGVLLIALAILLMGTTDSDRWLHFVPVVILLGIGMIFSSWLVISRAR